LYPNTPKKPAFYGYSGMTPCTRRIMRWLILVASMPGSNLTSMIYVRAEKVGRRFLRKFSATGAPIKYLLPSFSDSQPVIICIPKSFLSWNTIQQRCPMALFQRLDGFLIRRPNSTSVSCLVAQSRISAALVSLQAVFTDEILGRRLAMLWQTRICY
jgi:hypothetical protein